MTKEFVDFAVEASRIDGSLDCEMLLFILGVCLVGYRRADEQNSL